ncbi:hypothetical protein [Cronobacter sakazakii]|uniref:hypothetical protein n=1 Tax=Cronobacter sakazakii TaxID=28141 RepID=UPI0009BC38A5|nr:hypothetical protein [Cronobacter sakazakii]PUY19823.1 hypothetical protein BTK72_04500 [Cronobacter sakazakii]
MNNDELITAGHELAKCLDSNTPLIDIAKLLSKMATQLDVTTLALREKTKQCDALANELNAVEAIHNDAVFITDDHYDQCPPQVQKIIRKLAVMVLPSTDAFLCEVKASVIPEGYALVPQQIFLDPSDIESICSQCGDGHESGYGDFTDGLLWVGNIQRDDGSIVHGLHISSADYSEEGGVTVCEFAAQLRQGGAA